jgi:hypothetical protein
MAITQGLGDNPAATNFSSGGHQRAKVRLTIAEAARGPPRESG